jgi:acyl dehydratase
MSVPEEHHGGGRPDVIVPIWTAGLGAEFGRYRTEMTRRRIMAFAAGIGADEALYFDDARPEGIVAPLAITCSTDWQIFTQPDWLAAIGRDPDTMFNHLVHGSQVTEFHRAVRPGDLLEVVGRIVELRASRAGALVTVRIETTEASSGTPVATGWFASLYRETPLDGPGGASEAVPVLRAQPEIAGQSTVNALPVPRTQAHVYTECADIWNPIHTERAFALASGLPDIILHGTCTWARTLQLLAAVHRPGSERPFRRFGARFSGYVVPGHTVQVEHSEPDEDGRIAFLVRNAKGRIALSHGLADLA